jgi:hypothetical protein
VILVLCGEIQALKRACVVRPCERLIRLNQRLGGFAKAPAAWRLVAREHGQRVGLASLMAGTPVPRQLPPLSSSRAKQPGLQRKVQAALMAANSSTVQGGGKRRSVTVTCHIDVAIAR